MIRPDQSFRSTKSFISHTHGGKEVKHTNRSPQKAKEAQSKERRDPAEKKEGRGKRGKKFTRYSEENIRCDGGQYERRSQGVKREPQILLTTLRVVGQAGGNGLKRGNIRNREMER